MVVKHFAHGLCKSDSRYLKNPSIVFLRFPNPKNESDRCKTWVADCRRAKFTIKKVTKYSFICSLHFISENGPTELNPDPVSATFSKMSVVRSLNASDANQPTLRNGLEMDIEKCYKGSATFKFLCGINSSGGVTFLSDAYEGAISDRDLFISCGITSHLRKGDLILAGRGFNISDVCNSLSCNLLTPPFLSGRDKLTREEVRITKDVASARVHVERLIGRLKEYGILQRVLPKTLVPLVSQMTYVIAMLVNFQEPIIQI